LIAAPVAPPLAAPTGAREGKPSEEEFVMRRALSSPAILAMLLVFAVPIMAHAVEKEAAAASAALAKSATAGVSENASAQPATAKAAAPHAGTPSKLDLNHATREQLLSLPGMDAPTADRIIAARPFHAPGDLLERKLVSKAEYDKVHGRVMVAPAKKG
jgi:Helix-hairpin-helix motif